MSKHLNRGRAAAGLNPPARIKPVAFALAGTLLSGGMMTTPDAQAAGFIDDSTLTGGVYYWQRERDRKDLNKTKEETRPDGSKVTVNNPDYNKYATTFHMLPPTLISISPLVMPGTCLGSTWQPLPLSKWRKPVIAAILMKLLSLPATMLMEKIILAIKAESACIKRRVNSNTADSGATPVISSRPGRSWLQA